MAPSTTPSQTVGPFFHFLVRPGEECVVPPDHPEAIRLEGRVVDGEGAPIPDAMIEIWQADTAGRYAHPDDPRHEECDPSFTGFARAGTDAEGRYRFVTIRPGAVPGPDGDGQAAHIAMSVFARGLLERVTTRVYLPNDDDVLAADAVLAQVDSDRRSTLLAVVPPDDPDRLVFDIRMQGDGETVFFDV
jgi:protocatechuate 3,4-dioxygenase, alpha subunit